MTVIIVVAETAEGLVRAVVMLFQSLLEHDDVYQMKPLDKRNAMKCIDKSRHRQSCRPTPKACFDSFFCQASLRNKIFNGVESVM